MGIPRNQPVRIANTLDELLNAVRQIDVERHALGYGTDGDTMPAGWDAFIPQYFVIDKSGGTKPLALKRKATAV